MKKLADYAKMYRKLFNAQTDAIRILQKAQQETEEMFLSVPEDSLRLLDNRRTEDDDDKE